MQRKGLKKHMPKVSDTPPELKPYVFHGLDLQWKDTDKNATCECPFCGAEDKFSVNLSNSMYGCWSCDEKGNSNTFIKRLWEESDKQTNDYDALALDRSLVFPDTLIHWGVCRSIVDGCWMVPAYNIEGSMIQLHRYVKTVKGMRLFGTPGKNLGLFGAGSFPKEGGTMFLTEGPWDAMALWEILGNTKEDDEGRFSRTSNRERSIAGDANVIGVPGANIFFDHWTPLFKDKNVFLMYDSDHPKNNPKTGKAIPPSGYAGMERVTKILSGSNNPPASVSYLRWGEFGYDRGLPSGTDVRDFLCQK